jgi:hypothetical protein
MVLESWGGPVLEAPDAEALCGEAGLETRRFPGPSWVSLVVGRK